MILASRVNLFRVPIEIAYEDKKSFHRTAVAPSLVGVTSDGFKKGTQKLSLFELIEKRLNCKFKREKFLAPFLKALDFTPKKGGVMDRFFILVSNL